MRISETVQKMIMVMCITAAIMIIAGFIGGNFHPAMQSFYFAVGVAITTVLNIIKTIWLERSAEKVSSMVEGEEAAATNHLRMHYLLRFFLTLGVLAAIGLYSNQMNVPSLLWGAVAGVFTFHPAKYALYYIVKE